MYLSRIGHAEIMHNMNLEVNAANPRREFALALAKMHHVRVNNLAKYRELRGWTQQHLADVVGVTQSTIQRAESEHPSAKLSTYKACATALGVSVGDIFADKRSEFEAVIIGILRRIPVEHRPEIVALVEAVRSHEAEVDE